jgi:hypothetical protein
MVMGRRMLSTGERRMKAGRERWDDMLACGIVVAVVGY